MSDKNKYTIIVYTEDQIGLLNRITVIFTRRHVNIVSLNVSHSELEGVSRFTIVVKDIEGDRVRKIVTQIEKQIEVLKAYMYTDEETIYQELALIKLSTKILDDNQHKVEEIIRDSNSSIVSSTKKFIVIEKTGHYSETADLLDKLRPFGVMQFVRSGRVSVTREVMDVSAILRRYDKKQRKLNNNHTVNH